MTRYESLVDSLDARGVFYMDTISARQPSKALRVDGEGVTEAFMCRVLEIYGDGAREMAGGAEWGA